MRRKRGDDSMCDTQSHLVALWEPVDGMKLCKVVPFGDHNLSCKVRWGRANEATR